jgi:predicted metalloprotease
MRPCATLVVACLGLLLAIACSVEQTTQGGQGYTRQSADGSARSTAQQTTYSPSETTQETDPVAVGLGEIVELDDLRLRTFEVRSEDTVYSTPGPGEPPVSAGGPTDEYLAVDYVVENASDSPAATQLEVTLKDAQGGAYSPESSIEPPGDGLYGAELEPGEKRASTFFFKVPSGTSPGSLELEAPGAQSIVDLTENRRDEIPAEDYLYVYHLYFNERAYEEAYGMLAPDSTKGISLGEWLTFYEPLWGERYIALEWLDLTSSGPEEATFSMLRTFYGADGSPIDDPDLNAPVTQEMKWEGEWKLVMREDLAQDILYAQAPSTVSPTASATPESTAEATTTSAPAGEDQEVIEELPEVIPAQANAQPPVLAGPEGKPLEPFLYEVGTDLDKKWAQWFAYAGHGYISPNLTVYDEIALSINGCGGIAQRAAGPFYCPDNYTIYFPSSFTVRNTGRTFEGYGDFAVATVMAHEFAHHVQNLLGILQSTYSIQHELQADCLSGTWATTIYYEGRLEEGDVEEAITLLANIGDMPGTLRTDPRAHGTYQERIDWFWHGYQTGDPDQCVTY